MDWNEEEDKKALTRIAQMLVSLAILADLSCNRSGVVRRLILWILKPAEAYARNSVLLGLQAVGDSPPALPAPFATGDSIAEAMHLAGCFRALAIAVQSPTVELARPESWGTHPHTPPRHSARILLDWSKPDAVAPGHFDTS